MLSHISKPEVICIGSTSIDIFFPTDEGVVIDTPEDITSQKKIAFELGGKVLVPELFTDIGGVAANVSQGLAKIGRKVSCYSCIGSDNNGKFCLEKLHQNGVHTKLLKKLTHARTDLSAIIVLLPIGERTIIHNRDANKHLVLEEKNLQSKWVFVSALNGDWQQNMQKVLDAQLLSNKKHRFQLAFNPGQHNIKEDSPLLWQVIRRSEILVLNKDEAQELVMNKNTNATREELEDDIFLLKSLQNGGAKIVALTDGKRGAWVYNGVSCWFLPTPIKTHVVDTTGAGDAFTSAFFGAYLHKKPLDECLRYGMANSQSVIGYYGCNEGLLTQAELEERILHLIPQKLV